MNCPKCQAELSGDSVFCNHCGYKIDQRIQCKYCGHTNKPGTKFCEECGKNVGNHESDSTYIHEHSTEEQSRKRRIYHDKAVRLRGAASTVEQLFKSEGLDMQKFEHTGEIIIQGRKPPTWYKKALGLDVAASVKLFTEGNDLIAEIGGATWMDKAAGVGIGLFVFWPTLFTAGWGTYMQNVLFKKIDDTLRTHLDY